MTFGLKLVIVWVLASGMAGTLVAGRPAASFSARATARRFGVVAVLIAIIAAALIIVGVVSHTLHIHIVQVTPLVLALLVIRFEPELGVVAAASLFAFWFCVMGGIWLFVLGIARIFTGTFSPTEIVLTVVIGVASVAGLGAASRPASRRSTGVRVATTVVFGALQAAALWLSYQPFATGR